VWSWHFHSTSHSNSPMNHYQEVCFTIDHRKTASQQGTWDNSPARWFRDHPHRDLGQRLDGFQWRKLEKTHQSQTVPGSTCLLCWQIEGWKKTYSECAEEFEANVMSTSQRLLIIFHHLPSSSIIFHHLPTLQEHQPYNHHLFQHQRFAKDFTKLGVQGWSIGWTSSWRWGKRAQRPALPQSMRPRWEWKSCKIQKKG